MRHCEYTMFCDIGWKNDETVMRTLRQTSGIRLKPVSDARYQEWISAAVKVRGRYLKGKISASDFLREIDIFGELETYDVEQVSLPEPNSTAWRQNIRGNLDFDAAANYKGFMLLDLREENAEWKVWTPEEQEDIARGGHGSLREKYKK